VAVVIAAMNRSASRHNNVSSEYKYNGETARIISKRGLNLRDLPNSNGLTLLSLPYNETVGIIDKNGNSETISGQTANWYKVDYKGKIGWLWSGYLKSQ
jgi:hypothetical protein